jgi:hypothetical protein
MEAMTRLAEGFERKDWPAVLAELDPEVEIDDADIPEATGMDSFRVWMARWDEAWGSWHPEDIELRPADHEQAIALFTMVAKGRGSGLELKRADAMVASFRGGKVVKLGYYNDQAQALRAVGLEDAGGQPE